jgi:hypothetical protein
VVGAHHGSSTKAPADDARDAVLMVSECDEERAQIHARGSGDGGHTGEVSTRA